jgi:lipoyl(octanoyl) transferase
MKLNIAYLGHVDYKEALALQKTLRDSRAENKINDTLLLLEHNSVITLGRRGRYSNILIPGTSLKKEKIEIHEVTRGGDVTYHGPGQLVGYLIFDLKNHGRDVRDFVWKIQEVFIRLLKGRYNIDSRRDDGLYTGVWVENEKITAIGLAVSRWITMHGFAFNINTNLDHYKWINPCGITDRGITSLKKITGLDQDFEKVAGFISDLFCEVFGMEGDKESGIR